MEIKISKDFILGIECGLPTIKDYYREISSLKDDQWDLQGEPRNYYHIKNNIFHISFWDYYRNIVKDCIDCYTALYTYSKHNQQKFSNSGFNIQKYSPGKSYNMFHYENNGDVIHGKRLLAYMTYLNTIDEGGETEFLYQNMKIKPIQGLTLIWPAHWTHTHRGVSAPKETKYIITGWYSYDLELKPRMHSYE